jgi:pimeloyl-ACP methyl ester carboxylesterase
MLAAVGVLAGIALGVPALVYWIQEHLLFYPQPSGAPPVPPVGYALEDVSLRAEENTRLSGWLVRPAPLERAGSPAEKPSAENAAADGRKFPLVIYFGGNAEEVSGMVMHTGRFGGWALLAVNYRGYGASEGRPAEAALFSDARLLYDYAAARPDIDPSRIVIMGRSLGTGVAVHLAAERPAAGVVLVSPYDSITSVAQGVYPFLPVRLLLKHPFDSLSRAAHSSAPMLCLVGGEDGVIPEQHSRRLFDAWAGPKEWRGFPRADHNSIAGDAAYWDAIAAFLARRTGA